MDPAQLIPTPDTLPVAWPWLRALLIPCFAVHLLFMNALLGTAVVGWGHVVTPGGRELAGGISRKLPFYAAFTINFGVAALLFMQALYGHFFYASSILMAVWWLSVLVLVAAAYGTTYWIELKFERSTGGIALIWTVMVACLLLVAFVFTSNMTLMQNPAGWPRYFQAPGGTLWTGEDPTLLPRYFHFVAASVAVGGLVLAVINRNLSVERAAGYMRWFTVATALQLVFGGWLFVALPSEIRLAFMGGNTRATAFFAMALAGFLAAMAFGSRRRLWPSVGALLFTVAAMVLVRDALRDLYLAPYFTPDKLTVHPQYSPLVVFGFFVALGAAVVWYLVQLYYGRSNR